MCEGKLEYLKSGYQFNSLYNSIDYTGSRILIKEENLPCQRK